MCFLLLLPHRKKGYFNRYYSKNLFGFFWISILNKVAPSSKSLKFLLTPSSPHFFMY